MNAHLNVASSILYIFFKIVKKGTIYISVTLQFTNMLERGEMETEVENTETYSTRWCNHL